MKLPVRLLVVLYSILIVGLPAAAVMPLLRLSAPLPLQLAAWVIAPALFALTWVVTAGVLSLPHQGAIVAGTFPRRLEHAIYGSRRLYGLCWTAVYYAGPIYQLLLTIPATKKLMLRLFGYRGDLDITLYSDTWVRDLPLLDIGRGAYLSNKATIGTNICLQSGDILVDKITLAEGALVGHLTMLGPGAAIGKNAEVGVGCAIGIKVSIGDGARIGPAALVNHGARIGNGAQIGSMAYIGARVTIADGVCVPSGARIPDRAVIASQADVERYVPRIPAVELSLVA